MGLFDRFRSGGGDDQGGGPDYEYPLERTNERTYPPDFEGDIFVWDIDKTYLVSEFDSFKGLLTIPFEFAVDKRNIAGTDTLLRALRRGADPTSRVSNPLYFISASPAQLRRVIERKMTYDGVEYDGITFKDHLAILRSRRMGRIRHQIGYKVSALLRNRMDLPWNVREFLFGDDSESDAVIYSLYADIVAGRLRGSELRASLVKNHVDEEDADYIVRLAGALPQTGELVQRIYINLEKRSPPSRFEPWGRRVVPCYDTFQMVLHLFQLGLVSDLAVFDVSADLLNRYNRRPVGLMRSALDLVERQLLDVAVLAKVWDGLGERQAIPPYVDIVPERAPAVAQDDQPDFVTPLSMLALGR